MYILPAIISLLLVVLVYLYYANIRDVVGVDNQVFHLLVWVLLPLFIQSFGFLVFDVNGRYIDTLSVGYVSDSFLYGSLYLTFLAILTVFLGVTKFNLSKLVVNYEFSSVRENISLGLLFIFVLIGLVWLSSELSVDLSDILFGSKKWLAESSSSAVVFESNGYARFLIGLGTPVFLYLFAKDVFYGQVRKLSVRLKLFVIFLIAFLPQVMLSARGAAIYILVAMFFVLFSLGKVKSKHVVIGSVLIVFLLSMLTILRMESEDEVSFISGVEARVFYGGGSSLFNTSVIADSYLNTPAEIKYGASYIGLLFAWVPRALWSEKPVFAYDQQIANDIYGIYGYGFQAIPAGVVGELIMNFGPFLSIVFLAVLVWLVGVAYGLLKMKESDFFYFTLRCVVFPRFMIKLYGSGIGFAVMDFLLIAIPLFALHQFLVIRKG